MMKKTVLTAAFLAVVACSVQAAEFTPSVVPASALWVGHLDMAGLKGTAVGQALLADPRVADSPHRADFASRFGLDPVRDVRGLTLYTDSTGRLDAVVVFDTEPAAAKKLEAWRAQAGLTADRYGAYTIFSRSAGEGVPYQAVTDRGLVVAALSLDGVKRSLDVLDGTAPALDLAAFPAMVDRNGGAGSFAMVAGKDFGGDAQRVVPQVALLKEAGDVCLVLGEREGRVTAAMSVCAAGEPEAERLRNALLGLVELSRAMAANEGKAEALSAIAVSREGRTIRATGAWETGEVLKAAGVAE